MTALGRTLGAAALSWVVVTLATFLALRATPGDPARIFAGHAGTGGEAYLDALRATWGLDGALGTQFLRWLGGFLSGDWGRSFLTGQPVAEMMATRAPLSAAIGCGGLMLAAIAGFGLGYLAARRPAGPADIVSRALAVASQALPAFALGLVLLWLLAAELRVIRPLSGGLAERIALPLLVVALYSCAGLARVTASAFREAARADWMRTAEAKGLTRGEALWRHGRRPAMLTLLAALTPEAAWAVGGTAVAEIVFGTPGLSEAVVAAVVHRDYPVLQAFCALIALWIILIRGVSGIGRRGLDPRLRS